MRIDTDAAGLFTFDFVHAGVSFTIAAVDTGGLTVEAIQTILNSSIGDRFALKIGRIGCRYQCVGDLGRAIAGRRHAHRWEGLDRAVWSDNIEYGGGRMGMKLLSVCVSAGAQKSPESSSRRMASALWLTRP